MSTWQERRAALDRNSTAKTIWIVLLALEGLSGVIILIVSFGLAIIGSSFGTVGGWLAGFSLLFGIIGLALVGLIFWGLLRLEQWVVWLMWISVVLNLPNLFSKNFYQGLLAILIAIGYTWVLRMVGPPTTTVPPANPPISPTPPAGQ